MGRGLIYPAGPADTAAESADLVQDLNPHGPSLSGVVSLGEGEELIRYRVTQPAAEAARSGLAVGTIRVNLPRQMAVDAELPSSDLLALTAGPVPAKAATLEQVVGWDRLSEHLRRKER